MRVLIQERHKRHFLNYTGKKPKDNALVTIA